MREMKYIVPEGMILSGMIARNCHFIGDRALVKDILEAAIKWQSENPIVPTREQVEEMQKSYCEQQVNGQRNSSAYVATEWQRRMYCAPEPDSLLFTTSRGNRFKVTVKDGIVASTSVIADDDPEAPKVGMFWPPRYAENQVPKEIKDLIEKWRSPSGDLVEPQKELIEAFRRGQRSK